MLLVKITFTECTEDNVRRRRTFNFYLWNYWNRQLSILPQTYDKCEDVGLLQSIVCDKFYINLYYIYIVQCCHNLIPLAFLCRSFCTHVLFSVMIIWCVHEICFKKVHATQLQNTIILFVNLLSICSWAERLAKRSEKVWNSHTQLRAWLAYIDSYINHISRLTSH
jgi:hypothetical protein